MRFWPLPSSAAIALLLPLSGCCSLARYFCGLDRTPWVAKDWSTPDAAVKTLLEALRRADPEVLYDCLSDRYRDQLGITNLIAQVGWERFQEANPGLHVAGYAEVPPATRVGHDVATFALDVEGTPVDVRVVRRRRWSVAFSSDSGALLEKGAWLPGPSFAGVATSVAEADKERSRVTIGPLTVRHGDRDELPLDRIESAGIETVWRIDDIRVREAP